MQSSFFSINQKSRREYCVTLLCSNPNHHLLKSMGIISTQSTPDTITFSANTVTVLNSSTRFSYLDAENAALTLTTQIEFLWECGFGFMEYCMEGMILINGNTLFYLASPSLCSLNRKNPQYLDIYTPPLSMKTCFKSPEISRLCSIPSKVHRNTISWSMATFLLFHILPHSDKKRKEMHINELRESKIWGTGLSFFLERCLSPKPNLRVLLL
jgi:hypothetical protein